MGGRWWQMVLAAAVAIINLCVKFCILNSAFPRRELVSRGQTRYHYPICHHTNSCALVSFFLIPFGLMPFLCYNFPYISYLYSNRYYRIPNPSRFCSQFLLHFS